MGNVSVLETMLFLNECDCNDTNIIYYIKRNMNVKPKARALCFYIHVSKKKNVLFTSLDQCLCGSISFQTECV